MGNIKQTAPSQQLLWDRDHCGVDESGKGDYFGPLVVAGVFLPLSAVDTVRSWGVCDSKRLTDKRALQLAEMIASKLINHSHVFAPPDYNVQYQKFNNLNKMLAYGHAQVIDKLLIDSGCKQVLVDKFGPSQRIPSYLSAPHRLELRQVTNAERDLAVACASILARAGFLNGIKQLQDQHSYPFAKGSSVKVKQQAQELLRRYGRERLHLVAKTHFKML